MPKLYDQRPVLHIESLGETIPRRCLHVTTYLVTSRREVTPADFTRLRECGLIGSGQSWRASGPTPRQLVYTPDGVDWAGRPYPEVSMPYFEYTVTDTCDSGD